MTVRLETGGRETPLRFRGHSGETRKQKQERQSFSVTDVNSNEAADAVLTFPFYTITGSDFFFFFKEGTCITYHVFHLKVTMSISDSNTELNFCH